MEASETVFWPRPGFTGRNTGSETNPRPIHGGGGLEVETINMTKIRKNFVLDKRTVQACERVAKKNKRSLTAHLEFLMYNDAVNEGEYFKTVKKV